MKYLIVGLGNIGREYADTRHNVGFMVLDELAKQKEVEFDSDRLANVTDFKFKGRGIHLVKPTTYMNLSGKAVNYWMKTLKIPVSNTLIIMDDIALPFGTLRMRPKGASAGHNGLKNIEEILGTNAYPRLRFGVGDDFSRGKQAEYVLSPFSDGEFAELGLHIEKACNMILSFASVGIQQTMNQFNS